MPRLDQELVQQQLVASRSLAQQLIKAGNVEVYASGFWQAQTKPSFQCHAQQPIRLLATTATQYVSRGGLKLAGALQHCGLNPAGQTALDVGQSTGGFSDCLLQAGAAHVVGIDVGREQLAEKIKTDPRVTYYEGINARTLPAATLLAHAPAGFDLTVMDVSFISQALIVPELIPLIKPAGHLLCLVKPQFEVGKSGIGKKGIVRDPALYPEVKQRIIALYQSLGCRVHDYFDSPITGGDGNHEFFIWAETKSE
ncbi:TlyA family RNA methyltransferase [Gilvimarinus polysaccharolyticus]|uniref:TlyA family RNA methyltransferase n=1 Tax=Gilvimarinus polysaccharolyticus TaxID=863921 RepID=UPI0006732394|nr:TlyA family RNA methyltransferase [Gilvimarinus polysaccharolyticus]